MWRMNTLRPVGAVAIAATSLAVAGAALAATGTYTPATPVTITATATTATVAGAAGILAGPTQFSIKTPPGRRISIARLKPGKTVDDLNAAIAASTVDPTPVFAVADLLGGGGEWGGQPYRFATTLTAGTYEVVDTTAKPTVEGSFTVGAGSNGASLPTASATISLRDFKITSPSLRSGSTVSVVDRGPSPHFVAIAQLKPGTSASKVISDLRKGGAGQTAAIRLLKASTLNRLAELTSPGVTDVVDLPKLAKGPWVLASFYADAASKGKDQTTLGMEAVVTVK
jgi:hypothetical protein